MEMGARAGGGRETEEGLPETTFEGGLETGFFSVRKRSLGTQRGV